MSSVAPIRRRSTKAHAEWTTITPAIAQKWLELDVSDRTLSQLLVDKYAAEMTAGKWDEDNGETLKLASDGGVLDGQHRLWAIFQSGVTLRLLVVFDVDKDCFKTIDIGKVRTPGDVVGIAGVSSANTVAGAAAIVMCIEAKKYSADTHSPSRGILRSSLIEFCLAHKDELQVAARAAQRAKIGKMMSPSLGTAAFYLFSTKSKAANALTQAEAFFQQLSSGIMDTRFEPARHPIFILREKLTQNRASISRLPMPVILGVVIKAWNAYVTGRTAQVLRLVKDEAFPKVA